MKNLLTLIFIFTLVSISAQSDKDYKEIAQETCACLDTKEVTKENLEMNLGVCMIESIGDRPKLMDKIDFTNMKSMKSFGEKVGLEMAFICPEVFALLEEKPSKTKKNSSEANVETKTVNGKITGFEGKELIFVLVEDDNGRTKKFLWLRGFENDSELLNQGKAAVGKTVKINYQEIEIYNPSLEEYIKRKEITGIFF